MVWRAARRDDVCGICREPLLDWRRAVLAPHTWLASAWLRCGHRFHCACVEEWFQRDPWRRSCPVCRLPHSRLWDVTLDDPNQ